MSSVEELRNSRNRPTVAYTEFMTYCKRQTLGLFCFFEGKDNAYYVPRVKRYTDDYQTINCGGREAVLEVFRLISVHKEYDHYQKAFFIDRDFNPPTHNPAIFETPCYSIENFYVSVTVFKEILKNCLHVYEINEDYQICVDLFIERQAEFHAASVLFNAWYASLIDLRNTTQKQTGAQLDDKLPKGFIDITLETIQQCYDLNKIQLEFPKALAIEDTALHAKIDAFTICEQTKTFRGKYELYFVIVFIDLLINDAKKSKSFIKNKLDFTFSDALNNQRALEVFSSYAETPAELAAYLQQVTKPIKHHVPSPTRSDCPN